nr:MAG TPA: hypothetical protein [Caudoviricetes sp.]
MAPMHVIGEPCLRWRQGTNTLKFQNYGEFKKATGSHIGLLHQRRHADRMESDEQIRHDGAAEDCHTAPAQRLHHRWRLVLQPRRRQRAGCPLQRVSYGR